MEGEGGRCLKRGFRQILGGGGGVLLSYKGGEGVKFKGGEKSPKETLPNLAHSLNSLVSESFLKTLLTTYYRSVRRGETFLTLQAGHDKEVQTKGIFEFSSRNENI